MIKNKIYWIVLSMLLGFISCAEDDNVGDIGTFNLLRFDFPQGTNSWDKEIEQIAKDWGMYIIYKDVDSLVLNRAWTQAQGNMFPYYVCDSASDQDVQIYLELIKEWLLGSLDKTKKEDLAQLPLYLYLANNLKDNNRYSPTRNKHIQLKKDGFDYWCLSFTTEELASELTPEIVHGVACSFSYPGINSRFTSGEYQVAPGFAAMSNYEERVGIRYVSLEDFIAMYPYYPEDMAIENYEIGAMQGSQTAEKDPVNTFLRRGFAPQVSESFTMDRGSANNFGAPKFMPWIICEMNFPGAPSPIIRDLNPNFTPTVEGRIMEDFLNMIRLAMTYPEAKIREMFPVDAEDPLDQQGFQIINDKYDLVVEYMKTTYDVDLPKYAAILEGE